MVLWLAASVLTALLGPRLPWVFGGGKEGRQRWRGGRAVGQRGGRAAGWQSINSLAKISVYVLDLQRRVPHSVILEGAPQLRTADFRDKDGKDGS